MLVMLDNVQYSEKKNSNSGQRDFKALGGASVYKKEEVLVGTAFSRMYCTKLSNIVRHRLHV